MSYRATAVVRRASGRGLLAFLVLAGALAAGSSAAVAQVPPQTQRVLVPGLAYAPAFLATDRSGHVYEASGAGIISRIRVSTGKETTILTGVDGVAGLAVDRAHDVFFAAGNQIEELAAGMSAPVSLPFQGLQDALGVAVDPRGDVFAADFSGLGKVEELPDGSATPITLPLSNPQPTSIATDAAGDLFVFEYNGQVAELAAGSATPQILPFMIGVDSAGTVDPDGNVFATDSFHNTVTEYTAASWTPTVLPFGNELSFPAAIAVDAKDDVFVPNNLDQPLELARGSSAPTALGPPALAIAGVAAGPSRDAFFIAQEFTESSGGVTTTPVVDEVTGQHGETVRYTGAAFGLAVDRHGNLYIAAGGSGVLMLAPGATTPTVLFAAAISDATAVAVDKAGDVFVLEGNVGTLQEIKAGTTVPLTLPFPPLYVATGVAVDGAGDVFVSQGDFADSVLELPAGAQQVSTLSFPAGEFSAVASDAAGDVVVANAETRQISYLAPGSATPTMLPFSSLGSPSVGGPTGVAIDGHGDVFETDGALGLSELTGPLPPAGP